MNKALLVLAVITLGLIFTGVSQYNRMVSLNESITSEWSQVDNQLQRRNDLIPNLVNTVKGYAKHEKDIFEYVADARAKLAGAKTIPDKIAANQAMDSALSRLLVIVEQYPALKANENFARLQDELSGTENRIAVARYRYNEIVLSYNVTIKKFPGNIIASMTGFVKKDVYFKAEEGAKAVPKVEF